MTSGPNSPRRPPRRRYPPAAYLPFAIMVAAPLALIALAITLIAHVAAPSSSPATPTSTPKPASTQRSPAHSATPHATSVIGSKSTPARATAIPSLTPAPTTTVAGVTIALNATPGGKPVGAATVFHGAHITLWALATVPDVSAGDTVRVAWRDLDRHITVENWLARITVSAASYPVRVYAYLGQKPVTPFPAGHYRVDVYRNTTLLASSAFRVVSA